jgi:hypothetical protein
VDDESINQKNSHNNMNDDEEEKKNMKNDIALQRLLTESHLLSGDASQGYDPKGKARLKALDLRFQALGSKDSLFEQQNIPMNMRKGMIRKKEGREEKRRKDAKEAGIILEKEIRRKRDIGRRERGVGSPGVGKFKGGMLTLSKKDIISIQGKKRQTRRKGKK